LSLRELSIRSSNPVGSFLVYFITGQGKNYYLLVVISVATPVHVFPGDSGGHHVCGAFWMTWFFTVNLGNLAGFGVCTVPLARILVALATPEITAFGKTLFDVPLASPILCLPKWHDVMVRIDLDLKLVDLVVTQGSSVLETIPGEHIIIFIVYVIQFYYSIIVFIACYF
jgi:hypothetical protein